MTCRIVVQSLQSYTVGPGCAHLSLLPALEAVLAGAAPGLVILLGILIPLGLAALMSSVARTTHTLP